MFHFPRLPLARVKPASRKSRATAVRRRFQLESLERRHLLAAQPLTALGVPPDAFLGEPVSFQVSFSNYALADAGYGPYVGHR